jgi:hypothetical protein
MELDFAAGASVAAGLGGDVLVPSAMAEPIMRPVTAVVIMSFFNIEVLLQTFPETESPRIGQRAGIGDVPAKL